MKTFGIEKNAFEDIIASSFKWKFNKKFFFPLLDDAVAALRSKARETKVEIYFSFTHIRRRFFNSTSCNFTLSAEIKTFLLQN